MILDLARITSRQLDDAARAYETDGIVQLSGLDGPVTQGFRRVLAETIGVPVDRLAEFLEPRQTAAIFDREVRSRLSRIPTPPELRDALLGALAPVLTTLIGPLVHVSSTFHGQFKGGGARSIDHYHNEAAADFMEVHGPYRLHQDFTGASLPTSPSAVTLWVAMNTCSESTVRFYPGSHKMGLYCHRMWPLDDPRLQKLGTPIDIEARAGTGVLFNALLLHGTSNPGPLRRVSCDIRFFPLCGFLPSEVHQLGPDPRGTIHRRLEEGIGPVLRTPLLEDLVYLGESVSLGEAAPASALNWVNCAAHSLRGEDAEARVAMERFVNTDLASDPPAAFSAKFQGRKIHRERLEELKARLDSPSRRAPDFC